VPLYEYECPDCGRFERIQKFSDTPLRDCPTCGKGVQKLLSAPAIQFKGTGWYITDYARKGNGNAKGESKAGADSKGGSESKAAEGSKADSGGGKSEGASSSKGDSGSPSGPSSKPSS
jgi:putative FmdB family regulatory protein